MSPAERVRALALLVGACVALVAGVPLAAAEALTAADLGRIYGQAADRAREISSTSAIAVVDRDGRVLLAQRADGTAISPAERAIAISKAGTAVFLSSNGHAFSSRTAGFIIQQHFPPGVFNRPPGPLVGVGFSNLAFSDINYFRELDGSRIPGTRLQGSPGGMPLYKNGVLLAGIGVTGDGTEQEDASITGPDVDEAVALAGQIGFTPPEELYGSHVFIDGIRLSYIETEAKAAAQSSGAGPGAFAAPPAAVGWPTAVLGGVLGEVRAPLRADPLAGTINGQLRLTEDEVRGILAAAAARTLITRAGIRLPAAAAKAAQVFITVVNNPAQAGVAPAVLGTFRTPDATIFSWDVAIQKARTAVFFSSDTRAYSSRTVGFLAQSMYPPGLEHEPPGPFNGLQERFSGPVLAGGAINPNLPNGITIFPGGFPLYRNGVLIGAIGVSGDGIDQDDLIGASGTTGFQPALAIRADTFTYLNARLPYAKFPRDAELRPAVAPVVGSTVPPAAAPVGFETIGADEPPSAALANLSGRGWVAPGGPLILGFVTDNAVPTPLLLRGVGPALAPLGVGDFLRAPSSTLHDSAAQPLATNAGWSQSADSPGIAATGARVGAFPFKDGSADNALLMTLPAGAYTMVLASNDGGAGTALAEVYDAAGAGALNALKNVSLRGHVDADTHLLIAGLVVADGGPRTVLIRGVGPGLTGLGVPGTLAAPRLRLFNSAGQVVAEGAPWDSGSNAAEIATVGHTVGAFPLAAGSKDAALLIAVGPGTYTIQVSGLDGGAGEVLAEIYAVP